MNYWSDAPQRAAAKYYKRHILECEKAVNPAIRESWLNDRGKHAVAKTSHAKAFVDVRKGKGVMFALAMAMLDDPVLAASFANESSSYCEMFEKCKAALILKGELP